MALSATLPWLGIDGWLRFFFTSQHLLFAFGAAAFVAFDRGKVPAPGVVMAAGLLLFGATWAIPLMKLPLNGIVGNWAFGAGATLAILGAASLERARGLPVPRWLSFLGEASYAIYLAHAPVVYAATAGALALAPQLRQSPIVLFAGVAAVALAAGVAFHLWVERPLLDRLPHTPPRRPADKPATTAAP
jgi:peptidoglycan/LPS O-acetylase OafA/YrhL